MTMFDPILRIDKVRASTFNSRFEQLAAALPVVPGISVIMPWTNIDGETVLDITGISPEYEVLLFMTELHTAAATVTSGVTLNGAGFGSYLFRRISNGTNLSFSTAGDNIPIFSDFDTGTRKTPSALWILNCQGAVKHFLQSACQHSTPFGLAYAKTGGVCINTGPITQLTLTDSDVGWSNGSAAALYGLKG